MMNVGIKNALLLLMIILILHFLLMNIIADNKKVKNPQQTVTSHKQEDTHKTQETKQTETFECSKATENDLLAYVMQDEGMNAIESNDTKFEVEMPIVCDTTKYLEKDDHLQISSIPKPKKQKKDHMKAQINNNFLVIQEYENEKGLNGGKFFDGLCGFDEYGDSFQTI